MADLSTLTFEEALKALCDEKYQQSTGEGKGPFATVVVCCRDTGARVAPIFNRDMGFYVLRHESLDEQIGELGCICCGGLYTAMASYDESGAYNLDPDDEIDPIVPPGADIDGNVIGMLSQLAHLFEEENPEFARELAAESIHFIYGDDAGRLEPISGRYKEIDDRYNTHMCRYMSGGDDASDATEESLTAQRKAIAAELTLEARPEGVTYVYRGTEEVETTDWKRVWEAMIDTRIAAATLYINEELDGATFTETLLTKHGDDTRKVWAHQYKGLGIFTKPMPVVYAKKPAC
jgi:hypothetical protein